MRFDNETLEEDHQDQGPGTHSGQRGHHPEAARQR